MFCRRTCVQHDITTTGGFFGANSLAVDMLLPDLCARGTSIRCKLVLSHDRHLFRTKSACLKVLIWYTSH